MGDSYKGTSAEQDRRFKDKQATLLRRTKFPPEFDRKVDMRKVNLAVMRPWIARKVTELLTIEDDVVVEYATGLLEDPDNPTPDPKLMQINLTGFLESNTPGFMLELWKLLLSAQESIGGIPAQFLEEKKAELRRKQEEDAKMLAEVRRREEQDRRDRGIPPPSTGGREARAGGRQSRWGPAPGSRVEPRPPGEDWRGDRRGPPRRERDSGWPRRDAPPHEDEPRRIYEDDRYRPHERRRSPPPPPRHRRGYSRSPSPPPRHRRDRSYSPDARMKREDRTPEYRDEPGTERKRERGRESDREMREERSRRHHRRRYDNEGDDAEDDHGYRHRERHHDRSRRHSDRARDREEEPRSRLRDEEDDRERRTRRHERRSHHNAGHDDDDVEDGGRRRRRHERSASRERTPEDKTSGAIKADASGRLADESEPRSKDERLQLEDKLAKSKWARDDDDGEAEEEGKEKKRPRELSDEDKKREDELKETLLRSKLLRSRQ